MSQFVFPDESALAYRLVDGKLATAAGSTVRVYADAAAASLAPIQVYDGTATPGAVIASSSVIVDAYSQIPPFWGGDGVETLWIRVDDGALVATSPNDALTAAVGGGGGDGGGATALTRSEALDLRDNAGLVPGGSYLITDGPTIGVTADTSATQILLHATSASEFARFALVHTAFASPDTSAWTGQYDIDFAGGTLIQLEDVRGNCVWDPTDAIIRNQFPWGYPDVAGNRIVSTGSFSGVTLTGWGDAAVAGATITANAISGVSGSATAVDLTGLSGALTIDRCEIAGGAQLNLNGDGAIELTASRFRGASVNVDSGISGALTVANSDVDGTISVLDAGDITVINSRIDNSSEVTANSSGAVSVIDSQLLASTSVTNQDTGYISITDGSLLTGTPVENNASSPGFVQVQASVLLSSAVSTAFGGGTGRVTVFTCIATSSIIGATAASTYPLSVQSSTLTRATLSMQRTGTGGQNTLYRSQITDSSVTWTGSNSFGGGDQDIGSLVVEGGSAIVVDAPNNVLPLQRTTVSGHSTLNVQAGATVDAMRVSGGGTVNTGAFTHTNVVIDSSATTTLGAATSGLMLTGNLTVPRLIAAPVALTDAATIATNAALGNYFRVTLGGNRTLGNPTNPVDEQRATWELIQDATGSRTLALDTKFALGTDITSTTLTTTASKRDFLGAIYNATADKWYVVSFIKGF